MAEDEYKSVEKNGDLCSARKMNQVAPKYAPKRLGVTEKTFNLDEPLELSVVFEEEGNGEMHYKDAVNINVELDDIAIMVRSNSLEKIDEEA